MKKKKIKKKVENMYPKQAVSTDRAKDLNIIFYRGVRANTKRMRVYGWEESRTGRGRDLQDEAKKEITLQNSN